MRFDPTRDPRTAPLALLGRLMPVPGHDREEREERHLLRRIELREAVRR